MLKGFRYGNKFEWFVTLGSWEDLQVCLPVDRLASAIVTDSPPGTNIQEAGGDCFEMHQLTPSPAPQNQNAVLTGPSDSGYVPARAETGLGFGIGHGNHAYPHAPGTPSPRATLFRDRIQPGSKAIAERRGGGLLPVLPNNHGMTTSNHQEKVTDLTIDPRDSSPSSKADPGRHTSITL